MDQRHSSCLFSDVYYEIRLIVISEITDADSATVCARRAVHARAMLGGLGMASCTYYTYTINDRVSRKNEILMSKEV